MSDQPLLSTILGTDWVNLVAARDYTAEGRPYYCEIHLKIELASADVHDRLKYILGLPDGTDEQKQLKETALKELLRFELERVGKLNESTRPIVDAIKLR